MGYCMKFWDCIKDFTRRWPVIDSLLILIVAYYIASAWGNLTQPPGMETAEEREIALTTIQGAINASITGVSIILAAVAAVIGIRKDLPKKSIAHYRIAALLAVVSLFCGIWNMGVLPQLIRQNIAYEIWVAIPLMIQIWGLLASGVRLLLAIFSTI